MSLNLEPIIDIQSLTKEYNNKIVVDGIRLKIIDSCFALLTIFSFRTYLKLNYLNLSKK